MLTRVSLSRQIQLQLLQNMGQGFDGFCPFPVKGPFGNIQLKNNMLVLRLFHIALLQNKPVSPLFARFVPCFNQ